MKIKSHTGEMVQAREGDVVFIPKLGQAIVKNIDGVFVLDTPCKTRMCVTESDIALEHRPFQVGDDIEAYLPLQSMGVTVVYSWHLLEKDGIGYEYALRSESPIKGTEILYRHANPSLRDAPDYKP